MRRTGVAPIVAGALYFVGQGGELVFDSPEVLVAVLGVGGFVGLAVALWGLRGPMVTRMGRVGSRISLVGVALLGLFGVQVLVELIRTGDIPENFVLFALGFLLILVGQLLFARDLRHAIGRAWILPLVDAPFLVVPDSSTSMSHECRSLEFRKDSAPSAVVAILDNNASGTLPESGDGRGSARHDVAGRRSRDGAH